jgi:DnaJ-class molecular chaperone
MTRFSLSSGHFFLLLALFALTLLLQTPSVDAAKGRDYYKILVCQSVWMNAICLTRTGWSHRMIMSPHFALQGVDKNVDEKKLKRAYRKLSLKFHPDKCKKPECNQKFLDVSNGER